MKIVKQLLVAAALAAVVGTSFGFTEKTTIRNNVHYSPALGGFIHSRTVSYHINGELIGRTKTVTLRSHGALVGRYGIVNGRVVVLGRGHHMGLPGSQTIPTTIGRPLVSTPSVVYLNR